MSSTNNEKEREREKKLWEKKTTTRKERMREKLRVGKREKASAAQIKISIR